MSDVSEPLEPPRVSSRTRKIKKTAVDGLGEPLSARQVGRTRNLLGTPQIRNPLEAGRTKSRFCLRPFAWRNTVAPRCELTRTFDPPRSRARPSRARADPCRCAARVSGPTSAPAARAHVRAARAVLRTRVAVATRREGSDPRLESRPRLHRALQRADLLPLARSAVHCPLWQGARASGRTRRLA